MQKPILSLTLAYTAGLLLGHGFLYFPFSMIAFLALGIVTAGILLWFDKIRPNQLARIAAPLVVGMAAYILSAAWVPSDHYTRFVSPDKTAHLVIGTVSSPLDRNLDRTAFQLTVLEIDNTAVSGKILVNVREPLMAVGYGDRVRISGKVYKPRGSLNPGGFDYPGYLAQSGISYTLSVRDAGNIEILRRGAGIFRAVQDQRERIRQAFLASTTGPGSAILQAMVLGEEGGLTDEMRDQFMAAGVTHIISISGSHLGMVAVLCFGMIRWLMFLLPDRFYHRLTLFVDPKKIAAWLTLPLLIFYTLLAGGQVATVRSLVMISAGLAALVLDRDNALIHSLAIAALLILTVHPQALFDISFELSYLSVLVIGAVVALWNELGIKAENRWERFRNDAVLLISISLATSLATGPLVAHYFNQISFAGLLSNLIVVPFAGMVVVPLGLFSGMLSLVTHHLPLAGANQAVADAFIAVVNFFANLPFAEFHPPAPTIPWLLAAALFLVSLFAFIRARLLFARKPFEQSSWISKTSVAGMAIAGGVLVLSSALAFLPKERTEIAFPDVGQGDCTLVELASGKKILIDGGGTRDNKFDVGRRVLAPYLWNRGVYSLDLVILTHPHPDHMNGLLYLLKKFSVKEVWTHGRDSEVSGYAQFLKIVAEKKILRRIVTAGDPPVLLGDAELRILHPSPAFRPRTKKAYDAENNSSLVVRMAERDRVFLFAGDIGKEAEDALIESGQDLSCDLLKVPHHGSKSSSTGEFVARTRPKIVVVTVGKGNPYGHPSADVLARYEKIGSRICRTDVDGAVVIEQNPPRLDARQWSTLVLERIDLDFPKAWKEQEQRNRKRLWIRTWGI